MMTQLYSLFFWAAFLLLFGLVPAVSDDEPVLARLSFWLAPERMATFAQVYEKQVAPLLAGGRPGRELGERPPRRPARPLVDRHLGRTESF